jgi:hypothetical protein
MINHLENMTLQQKILTAVNMHANGDLINAEHFYKDILQKEPNNAAVKFLHSQIEGVIEASYNGTDAEIKLINSFINLPSHYYSVPAYNLNWMLKDLTPLVDFLRINPIIVADVGARGGNLEEISNLKSYISYYGFDIADEDGIAPTVRVPVFNC